jgi:adenosylhomocysteine nucleosidase
MRILVTFAVDAEFAPWRKLRDFQKSCRNDLDYFSAKVDLAEIGVLLTGVGCRKAWVEATKAIWDCDVDICISSGLAGALREEHRLGEVLVAEKVLASKWDKVVTCDPVLVSAAASSGAKKVLGFHTADRVILDSAEKHKLGAFADAVEMESGEILLEAAAFGARVVAIRAISDTANEDLPIDFNKVTNETGEVSVRRVLGEVVSAPTSIPALVRFGRQSNRAAEALAQFLEKYMQSLLSGIPASASSGAMIV